MKLKDFKENIKLEEWVLELMKEGLKLDFSKSPPPTYEEDNNKSAINNMPDLRKIVDKWEGENACVEVDSKPDWVSPLSVSIETDNHGNIVKKRPCIDLSRHDLKSYLL